MSVIKGKADIQSSTHDVWVVIPNRTSRALKRFRQGGVITRGKEKLAVWKDMNGKPHAFSASWTHLGCIVTWNNAERTWDCPCHDSMFCADGSVIHGPAVKPLNPKKHQTQPNE